MTLEEANKYADEMDKLNDEREEFTKKLIHVRCSDKHREFIEWLLTEETPCDTCEYEEGSIYCKEHCPHEAKIEQESCGDAIDRAVSLNAVKNLFCRICMESNLCYRSKETCEDLRLFDELPPVNPTKTGHWITTRTFMHDGEYYCDQCKCDSPNNEKWDYCPNCGCIMVESQTESEEV